MIGKGKTVGENQQYGAIINTGGSTNSRHQHGNSTISGAYYVRAPEGCGDIVF